MNKLNVRLGRNGKIESLTSDDGGRTWRTDDGHIIANSDIYDEPRFDLVTAGVFALLMLLISACCLVVWLGE